MEDLQIVIQRRLEKAAKLFNVAEMLVIIDTPLILLVIILKNGQTSLKTSPSLLDGASE